MGISPSEAITRSGAFRERNHSRKPQSAAIRATIAPMMNSAAKLRRETGGWSGVRANAPLYVIYFRARALIRAAPGRELRLMDLPVDAVAFAEDAVQRNKCSRFRLADRRECERLALHGANPIGRFDIGAGLERNIGGALGLATEDDFGGAAVRVVLRLRGDAFGAKASGENDGAVHRGAPRLLAEQGAGVQAHGELHVQAITFLPGAIDFQVAAGAGPFGEALTIEFGRTALRPVGNADADACFDGLACLDDERGAFLIGEARILRDGEALFRPLDLRRDKKIHEDAVVIVGIDRIVEFGKFLGAGARAAPEGIERGIEIFPIAGFEREIVHLEAVAGMLRAAARLEKRALVILHVARIGGPLMEMARELQHIVAAAAFFGGGA